MRFLLLLLLPIFSFAQNGLVTIKLKGVGAGGAFWSLNGNSIVDSNFLGTTNSKDLVFKTKNTEAMRIDTNGNVGIGTAAPIAKLHVLQTDTNTSVFRVDNYNSGILVDIGTGANPNILFGDLNSNFNSSRLSLDDNNKLCDISYDTTRVKNLEVNGNFQIEGTPQSTTSDSLLTIDNDGNVAWRTPYYYGTDTLTNGVDTVWTSDVTANSIIQLTSNGLNGSTQSGHLDVTEISAGNYFVINSLKSNTTVETGDQRKYYWFFIRKP